MYRLIIKHEMTLDQYYKIDDDDDEKKLLGHFLVS